MDFEKKIATIFSTNLPNYDKVNALANLLIPRIMYIPFAKISGIKDKITGFEAQFEHCEKGLFLLNIIQSFLTYRQEKYEAALKLLEKRACPINNPTDVSLSAYNSAVKGACFRSLGQKENALTAFHFSIKQFTVSPTEPYQEYLYMLAYYHIAEINAALGNFKIMLEKHHTFYALSKKLDNVDMINRGLNGVGRAYLSLKDYNNAIKYLQIAEQNSAKAANIPFKAKNLHDIGSAYYQMKSYENALTYLGKALRIREDYQLSDASISTYISMANVYIAQHNVELALETLYKALAISESLKTQKKSCVIYELLSTIYEKNKQFPEALVYYKKFHTTKAAIDDIKSAQKENERIRETNTKLHQQKNIITKQKKQIETYAAKLTDSNKLLQNFAYIAAHDLKAPMKVTGGFIDLVQKKHKHNWDDDDKQFFNFINQSMQKLSMMIDDLLSLSRLDQALPAPEIVDTYELVKDTKKRLHQKIQDLQPEIKIQKNLPKVLGHESLIGQVFQNLIDNALKYRSEATPRIEISYKKLVAEDKKGFMQFEIKDNGKGIPVTLHEKVFELFSGTRQKNSNGIGLATCKKIVLNYGGNIWVESKVGKGSTMIFTLPAVA